MLLYHKTCISGMYPKNIRFNISYLKFNASFIFSLHFHFPLISKMLFMFYVYYFYNNTLPLYSYSPVDFKQKLPWLQYATSPWPSSWGHPTFTVPCDTLHIHPQTHPC